LAEQRGNIPFREIVDGVGEPLLVLTSEGDGERLMITYANAALLRLTGLGAADVVGGSLRILRAAQTDPFDLARIARAASRRTALELRLTVKGAGGAVPVEATGRPLAGDDASYLVRLRDLSGEHAIARTLAQSAQRLQLFGELSTDCLYYLRVGPDCRLELEWTAGAFERLIGYRAEEIAALGGWTALIEPEDLKRVQRRGQKLLAGEPAVAEYRITARGGRQLWLHEVARPRWDAARELVVGAVCCATDVTEQRRLAERVHRAEVDFRALASLAEGLVLRLDHHGRIDEAEGRPQGELERRLRHATGRTLDEVLGEESAALWHVRIEHVVPGWPPVTFAFTDPAGGAHYSVALAPGAAGGVLALLRSSPPPAPPAPAGHAAARAATSRLEALFEHMADAAVLLREDLAVDDLNAAAVHLTGWSRAAVIGRPFVDLVSVADPAALRAELERARRGTRVSGSATRLRLPGADDGRVVWTYEPLRDASGDTVGVLARGTAAAHAEPLPVPVDDRQRLRSIIDHVADGVVALDGRGTIVSFSRTAEAVLGYAPGEIIGRPLHVLVAAPPHAAIDAFAQIEEIAAAPGDRREMWARHKGGEIVPVEVAASKVAHNGEVLYILTLRDITIRKQTEETIRTLAYLDALTGLPNRLLFNDRLSQAIERARRNDQVLAVLLLDLDRFKLINDSLGLPGGDQVLRVVGERLTRALRRSDTVARPGSDDFLVLAPGVGGAQNAARVAQKLLDALLAPIPIDSQELHVGASLGIALYPHDGESPETLTRNAETALYRAKERARGSYQFYTNDMNAAAFERLMLETQLRRAIERDELLLCYQPQVSLETGAVVGIEALVRWRHPEIGMVSPGEFIPLAEETGLILAIGRWVLEAACAQVRAWREQGITGLRLAVNLSLRQFQDADLVPSVERALAASGFDPADLELELTESSIMQDAEATIAKLQALDRLGIQLAIDDFGTGYSSLGHLKRFPIQTLKIDRSFVQDITQDPDAAAIAQAIIALGESLRLRVIAEGVETRQQLELLRGFGCAEMQGYLFSRPLSATEMLELLRRGERLAD